MPSMSRAGSPIRSSCVYNVPMALDHNLEHTRGLDPHHAKSRNLHMVDSSKTYTVGPMPVQEFLEDFLPLARPVDNGPLLSHKRAFNTLPERAETVHEVHDPLLNALNKTTARKARCPGFVFRNASTRTPLPRKLGHMKPDICCYRADSAGVVDSGSPALRLEFGYSELFIDVNPDPAHDFFVDPPSTIDPASHEFLAQSDDAHFVKHRERAFGQQVAYATEIFARQHRVFLFSITFAGSWARFIRWDRSGCVVSESFDVRTDSHVLCDFLARFSQTDDAGRGHDTTVEPALPEEEELFREVVKEHVRLQLASEGEALDKAVSEHYQPGHVTTMHILQHHSLAKEDTIHRFLVSRPVASSMNLVGRGTRGWWAVDPSTRQVAFLKDTWRAAPYDFETEGEILKKMNERVVRNVPSVLCYGDVPERIPRPGDEFAQDNVQRSLNDKFCDAQWVCKVDNKKILISKHWHYRIVLGVVGYSLRSFSGSDELLMAAYDVFQAMQDAVTKAARLHRDISIGNIILVRKPEQALRTGYLIDWDASCDVDDSKEATEAGRAGTWLFMSHRATSFWGLDGKQTIQDDIESLLYVVLYCALLWLPHSISRADLKETIWQIFERASWSSPDKAFIGGEGKFANAVTRMFTKNAKFSHALHEWLDTVMDHHIPVNFSEPDRDTTPWSADQLEVFWADFLRRHTLASNDRNPHDHPFARGDRERKTGLHSTEAIVLGKRPSEERDLEHQEKMKRRKGKKANIKPLEPSRRSERLAAQRNAPQPPAGSKRPLRRVTTQKAPRSPAKPRTRRR
ncbi:hypothetical protein V8D89_015086 [Ganoderma adspersum]